MKLVHQALSAHPHSQPYPRLTRFNSHRSAAPDKAASFKSLYLNRPAEDQAAQSVRTVGGPDTALRLMRTCSVKQGSLGGARIGGTGNFAAEI
jgi:hypothetical protein